jgi:hypothetical protein
MSNADSLGLCSLCQSSCYWDDVVGSAVCNSCNHVEDFVAFNDDDDDDSRDLDDDEYAHDSASDDDDEEEGSSSSDGVGAVEADETGTPMVRPVGEPAPKRSRRALTQTDKEPSMEHGPPDAPVTADVAHARLGRSEPTLLSNPASIVGATSRARKRLIKLVSCCGGKGILGGIFPRLSYPTPLV